MLKYIGKRLLAMIPVVLGVTLIVYCIMSLAPGDPARTILGEQASVEQVEALREEMGLNDPIIVQYLRYILEPLIRAVLMFPLKSGPASPIQSNLHL